MMSEIGGVSWSRAIFLDSRALLSKKASLGLHLLGLWIAEEFDG